MASRKLRAFRSVAVYRGLVIVTAIGRRIPRPVGRALGRGLGWLAWHVARRERKKALANIAIAFPDWDEARRRNTIRAMFRHLGVSIFEMAKLWDMDVATRDSLTAFEGIDKTLELIDAGHGVVVFTAHCGNWEWLATAIGLFGRPTVVLHRERDDPEMNRFITELRGRAGVRTIDRGSASSGREMIQLLRTGGILAFLIDQNIRTESVKVPFFGRPTPTPIGPAKLAIRTEAYAVPGFVERRPNGTHLVRFLEPIQCRRGDDAIALTARITREIERQIQRLPEQWVWMHDRWRERPRWDVTPPEATPVTDEGSGASR